MCCGLQFLTRQYAKEMAERQPPANWEKTEAPTIGALDSSTGHEEDQANATALWRVVLGDFEFREQEHYHKKLAPIINDDEEVRTNTGINEQPVSSINRQLWDTGDHHHLAH